MLKGLFEEDAFLQPMLASETAKAQLHDSDRRLAWELVLGVSRQWGTLSAYVDELLRDDFAKLPSDAQRALVLGAYQILHLDRIPPHAAVNESVELVKRESEWAVGLVNRVLKRLAEEGAPKIGAQASAKSEKSPRRGKERESAAERKAAQLAQLSAELSHPAWWVTLQLNQRSREEVEALAHANNSPAPLSIRVHPDRDEAEVLAQLKEEGATLTPSKWAKGTYLLDHPQPFGSPSFKQGGWYAQDEASQLVVDLLAPQAGAKVWDVCAAPGGKTLSLAERVGAEGWVMATELHPRKAEDLKDRLSRYSQVDALAHDASEGEPEQAQALADARALNTESGLFDAVLLDAPCSALGVVRRHPEIRWRRSLSDVKRAARQQLNLLHSVALSVRVGGTLVYSVCTDTPQETTEVIKQFLLAYPEFQYAVHPEGRAHWAPLLKGEAMSINPAEHGTDGFFAVRLKRVR